jgi:hypothetical protein
MKRDNSSKMPSAYQSWANMKVRCLNKNSPSYSYYGSRGIKVCKRWLKFQNFLEDMGERPKGKTLDRIDNDGHYEAINCRWATYKEQNRNTSRTVFIEIEGKSVKLIEYAELIGITLTAAYARLRRGWYTRVS